MFGTLTGQPRTEQCNTASTSVIAKFLRNPTFQGIFVSWATGRRLSLLSVYLFFSREKFTCSLKETAVSKSTYQTPCSRHEFKYNTVQIRKLGTGYTRKTKDIFVQLVIVNKSEAWCQVLFTTFLKSPGCNNHYVLKIYSKSKLVISFPLYSGIPRFGVVGVLGEGQPGNHYYYFFKLF